MDTPFFDDFQTVKDYFNHVATLFEEPPYAAPRLTSYGRLISLCWNCGGCGCDWCEDTDALEVLPPVTDDAFEDWPAFPEPEPDEEQHPHGLNHHGELCRDCEGEGGDVMDPDNYWVCDRCHGCGYYPPCGVHAPTAPAEPWSDLINSPITE